MTWRYSAGRRGPAFMLALVFGLGVLAAADNAFADIHPSVGVGAHQIGSSIKPEGALVCVKVLEGTTPPDQDIEVVARINDIRGTTDDRGGAILKIPPVFWEPEHNHGMFSGTVRITIIAEGYCPAACDLEILYNTPEKRFCGMGLKRLDPDDFYACSSGISSPSAGGPGPQYFVRDESDELLPVGDGHTEPHSGFGLICDRTRRPIEVMPGVPERVMPEMPTERVVPDTVDPRVVDPRRDPRVVDPRRDPGRVRPPSR